MACCHRGIESKAFEIRAGDEDGEEGEESESTHASNETIDDRYRVARGWSPKIILWLVLSP